MAEKDFDDQMSNLMREKVREVKAEGLSGQVKVLSRRALMDIVDQLIKNYGGLEHQELLSKIAEFEMKNRQLETQMASLKGKIEIYESQLGEIRKEDDELRAKLKADEGRLPMLEEQNQVLKKTVSGLEAEIENIKRTHGDSEATLRENLDKAEAELADLRAQLAETGPKIEAAEAARADAERRLQDQMSVVTDLEDQVEDAKNAKEKALADSREKIARLERALQESDARKRILELENEVSELKTYLEALERGLEFVDIEPAPRFEEMEGEIQAVQEILGQVPAEDAEAAPVREGLNRSRALVAAGRESHARLLELMYGNQGTVSVACELGKLLARQAEMREELKALKSAAGLLT